MLTDEEIIELEVLLNIESLDVVTEETTKNYMFLKENFLNQKYINEKIVSGAKGVVLEGGARSSKTWSVIHFIIYICLYKETNAVINIVRETYNEFKTTLYLDFKRILPTFGLDNPFERAKEVQSFYIGKNQINFIGADKGNKVHGLVSDYLYFNEFLPIEESIFKNATMRCSKFWIADFNPSVTEHWSFNKVIPRNDVAHLRTTFKDNPNIPLGQKIEILAYEPWLPGSYIVEDDIIKCYNKRTKKLEPISKDNQPPPHPVNIDTADEFMWKVYGLGLRGAMLGVIFQNVKYIDSFPEDIAYSYGVDFGFTSDPTAVTKCAEDDHNIWIELLLYEPVETPQELNDILLAIECSKDLPYTADSSDKYTGENKGTVEMVKGMKKLGWLFNKVSKNKGIMFWLLSMKKKKIHIVKNHLYKEAKKEQENYKLKEIHGIAINQPIDKFNHMWDSARYRHMAFNSSNIQVLETTESLRDLGINY
ncbi:terminase [Paenimyroides ceti]